MAVTDDEIAVLGRFQCQFTGFSAIHGSGTWLATGQHDLYVARFDLDSLYLKGAQQFGGQRNKVPGGIAYAPDHEPLFCGAFDRLLVFPAIPGGFSTTPQENGVSSADGGDFCSDPYYGSYVGLRGGALMDAFIARGYVAARSPYDIFTRTGGDCDRPALDVALRMGSVGALGPDSVAICDLGYLNVNTNTAYIPDTAARHNAPDLSFQWSTGSQSDTTHVLVTGWYRCTVTSNAGCWQRTDSIHVTVNPLPAIPLISDDVIVNTAALQAETVSGCEPFSPWLWTTTVPGNTVVWSGASGSVMNDSIQATNSGSHYVSVTTPAGCSAINVVQVNIVPAGELPAIEMEYEVTFPQDIDLNDTIMICSNLSVSAIAEVELFLGGSPIGLPYDVRLLYNCNDGSWTESHNGSLVVACGIDYGAEGWYSMTIGVMLTNAPCGTDTLIAYRTGTVYIIPYPVIFPQPLVSAPDFLCPGDTTSVLLDCVDCQQIVWTGPGIVENYTDSIRVVSAGYFGVVVTNVDTNGCVSSRSSSDQIQWNLRPLLGVLPTDGIICPDSSALIFSDTQGTDYQWYGPSGPLTVVNDTITTTQQGVYYLEMVDATGCFVTSDPVLVTDYATPYLNVLPDNSLCEEGETATLQVVTTGSSSFQWLAPLSGNAFQQVVDEAGIYRCSVNACGITTELSVEIFGNEALAELLQPGPFSICPDDTIALEAVPGMASYYWYPGPVFGTTLSVSEGGTYTLVTSDQHGCEASLVVEVTEIPWTETLVVSDTAICVGTPLVLNVPGSGIVTWFADPLMTEVIGTGNTLDLGTLSADTTVHVQQAENGCTSALRQIHVSVFAWPEVPEITGPDTLCAGTELVLSVIAEAGLSYEWITPAGLMEGSTIVIPDVSANDAGSYVLQVGNPACSVSGDPHSVTVLELFELVLSPDTTICPGGVAMFTLPDGFTDPTWSDGSTGSQFETSLEGPVTLTASGPNGCRSTGISFVNVYAFSQIVSAQPVTICLGNDATMTGSGSGLLQWFADPGLIELVTTGPQLFLSQPLDSTVFQLVQTEGGCVSMPLAVPLNVVPIPVDVTLVAPSDVCVGAPLTISLEGGPGLNATWVTPVGPAIGVELFYPVASLLNDGVYTAVPAIGPCAGDTISASINVLTPAVLDIGPDTVLCDGGQLVITLPTGFHDPLWSTGSTANSVVIIAAGSYDVTALDDQGCVVQDAIEIDLIDCKPIMPNVFSPNGDGSNDELTIERDGFVKAELQVFDRWGNMVWVGDPSMVGFRGVHYTTLEPLSEGTYFYVLRLDRTANRVEEIKGYFHIQR
ncbi:MAG: gliding motility-associated C-terminal domain-containing protein [Flavobacteriales bacterium]